MNDPNEKESSYSKKPNNSDLIRRQDVLALSKEVTLKNGAKHRCVDTTEIKILPAAQLDIAQNLSQCKCYITDEDGLQHEVIHTGDIRRVTGWTI